MNKQKIFNNVVKILYELQKAQPLNNIIFYPYETKGFENLDIYDLYECLTKLRDDYKVINEIFPSQMFVYPFSDDNPYPFLNGFDFNNQWGVRLKKIFPKWAEKYLNNKKNKD